MTCSGQVDAQRPHCTQRSSTNFSIGRSAWSRNAEVGHTETQERHRVQPAASTWTAADRRAARQGDGVDRRRGGAVQRVERLGGQRDLVPGRQVGRGRAARAAAAGLRVLAQGERIVGWISPSRPAPRPSATGDGVEQRDLAPDRIARVPGRARAGQHAQLGGAESEARWRTRRARTGPLIGQRDDAGRQPVAVPGQHVDERGAVGLVVQQQHRRLHAAGGVIGAEQRAQRAGAPSRRRARRSRTAVVGHTAAHWPQPAQI